MIGLIFVGCGNSVVKQSIEQAKNAIESKEYHKALASLELALDEDKDNEEANKIYSIVDGYQKAKKLVDENKIIEAKEIIDGINSDYINYAIKEDIDNLKSQVDNYFFLVNTIVSPSISTLYFLKSSLLRTFPANPAINNGNTNIPPIIDILERLFIVFLALLLTSFFTSSTISPVTTITSYFSSISSFIDFLVFTYISFLI